MGQYENGVEGQMKTAHRVNVRRFFHIMELHTILLLRNGTGYTILNSLKVSSRLNMKWKGTRLSSNVL